MESPPPVGRESPPVMESRPFFGAAGPIFGRILSREIDSRPKFGRDSMKFGDSSMKFGRDSISGGEFSPKKGGDSQN